MVNNVKFLNIVIYILYDDVVRISAPVTVIRIVCSNCAAGPPSAVTTVHLSGHVTNSVVPMVRIGSVQKGTNQFIKEYNNAFHQVLYRESSPSVKVCPSIIYSSS